MGHTAGDWALKPGDRAKREMSVIHKADDPEFIIGYVLCDHSHDQQRAEDLANGRLMAAAPKLLAACELFRQFDGENCQTGEIHYDSVKEAMLSAIAAAKGGAA